MLSYSDLNDSYRKQIRNANKDNDLVNDDNMKIPEGAKSAVATDEDYRGQVLRGEATYDEAKYEAFKFEQEFPLSPPFEEKGEFENSVPLDKANSSSIKESVNVAVNGKLGYNDLVSTFKTKHPSAKKMLTEITLTGLKSAKDRMNEVAEALRKLGAKVAIKTPKNYKPYDKPDKSKTSDQSFNVKIKVSGVE